MRLETKVTVHATQKEVEPLMNFIAWLEELDDEIANACDKELINSTLGGIAEDLEVLTNLFDVW